MATADDAFVVQQLIDDAATLLDWCAGAGAILVDNQTSTTPVIPDELRPAYAAAVDQLLEVFHPRVMRILSGEDPLFPMSFVLAMLEAEGWDGAMQDFKLLALDHAGRQEVMEVARGDPRGRRRPGRLPRRVFKAFMAALNAALDSLNGIPGVGVIRELKDFTEGVAGD